MSEKLTREEWEAFCGLRRKLSRRLEHLGAFQGLSQSLVAPRLVGDDAAMTVFSSNGRLVRRVDDDELIHDPERDRADLIARLEATIAEAGEAGEGLRVTLDEPVQTASDDTVFLRPTGEADVYSLHGGGYGGETVKWADGMLCEPAGYYAYAPDGWTVNAWADFVDITAQNDNEEHTTLTAYLAAIPGDWRLEGE